MSNQQNYHTFWKPHITQQHSRKNYFWKEEISLSWQATFQVRTHYQRTWVISELLKKNIILLPFAIGPLGCWGPIKQTFLTGNWNTTTSYNFPTYRPSANTKFCRATNTLCPLGILRLWTLTGKQPNHEPFSASLTHLQHPPYTQYKN